MSLLAPSLLLLLAGCEPESPDGLPADNRGGNLIHTREGKAYMTLSIDDRVRVYEPGMPQQWLGTVPEYFQIPPEDLPSVRGIDALMAAMRNLAPSSWTTHLFLLDQDRLMLGILNQYVSDRSAPEALALRVVDTSGNTLEREPIFYGGVRAHWVGAADGILYRSVPPTGDDDNPTLILYRFSG